MAGAGGPSTHIGPTLTDDSQARTIDRCETISGPRHLE